MTLTARPYLSLIFTLLSFTAFTQENYQAGYIVRSGADTVRGRIDFRDWAINPGHINFENRQGSRTVYSPQEITCFFVGGSIYRSYMVKLYAYAKDASMLTDTYSNAAPHDSTVFLRLVTGGKMNLYCYLDREDITYLFIQKQGTNPEQLQIRTSAVDNNGITLMSTQEIYKGQLSISMGDCPATARHIGNVAYTEQAMEKLVFSYNNCGKDTVEHQSAGGFNGNAVHIMPLAGFVHTSLRSGGSLDQGMAWPSYNTVSGGAGILAILPRSRQQYAFFVDLLYRHLNVRSNALSEGYGNSETLQFNYSQAQLDFLFRYRYPTGSRVRPFVNLGLSNTLIFSNKSNLDFYDPSTNTHTIDAPFFTEGGMKSYMVGIVGGLGIEAGRFNAEARLETTDGLSSVEGENVTPTIFYLLVGFSF